VYCIFIAESRIHHECANIFGPSQTAWLSKYIINQKNASVISSEDMLGIFDPLYLDVCNHRIHKRCWDTLHINL